MLLCIGLVTGCAGGLHQVNPAAEKIKKRQKNDTAENHKSRRHASDKASRSRISHQASAQENQNWQSTMAAGYHAGYQNQQHRAQQYKKKRPGRKRTGARQSQAIVSDPSAALLRNHPKEQSTTYCAKNEKKKEDNTKYGILAFIACHGHHAPNRAYDSIAVSSTESISMILDYFYQHKLSSVDNI